MKPLQGVCLPGNNLVAIVMVYVLVRVLADRVLIWLPLIKN